MKKMYLPLLCCLLLIGSGVPDPAHAQQATVGCVDRGIRLQADEIKQHYVAQGFTVYRDAMLNMESMSPAPVIVQLERGQLYEIIFVGHAAASRLKMELFDGADHKVDEQTVMRNRSQPNYIIYAYAPQKTDTYLMTFLQKLKNERMCGSLCILKMENEGTSEIKPFRPY